MAGLCDPATLDEADRDRNDSEHEEEVDEATQGGGGDEPESPEREKDDCEGPQHDGSLREDDGSRSMRHAERVASVTTLSAAAAASVAEPSGVRERSRTTAA